MIKNALTLRFILLKKEWLSLLFWLALPIVGTFFITTAVTQIKDDVTIPVGVVIEKEGAKIAQLVSELNDQPSLRLQLLDESSALQLLEQHKLDSVFVFTEKYEEGIYENKRRIIEAYYTEQSYAYLSTLELISSLAQEQASEGQLLAEVKSLTQQYNAEQLYDEASIIEKSEARKIENKLITIEQTIVSSKNNEQATLLPPLHLTIWSLLSMISTFFLMDWLVKERALKFKARWAFATMSFTTYSIVIYIAYFAVFLMMNISFLLLNHYSLKSWIVPLISYQFCLMTLAFFIAYLTRSIRTYYVISLSITLLSLVIGGGFIPLPQQLLSYQYLDQLHAMYAFLNGDVAIGACIICFISLIYYRLRGGNGFA